MKKLLYIGLAAAAGLAFFACSKDTSKGTDTPEESTGKLVTITASIPEEGLATKVSFAEDETTLRLTKIAWEAGDVLDIAGKTFTIVDASISTDGKTASFTGEEPAAASSYTVKYNSIASKGIDLNAQEQEANGSTKHLGYSIVVEASDYKTVSFENATSQSSVLQLRAKLPDGIKDDVKKVIFKSNLAVFNGEKQLTVALADGRTGDDNLLNVYATLPAGPVTIPSTEKMELLIQFQVGADYEKYTAYREFASDKEFIKDGAAQYIGIDCTKIESYANKPNDQIGTAADNPYLIGDKYQLKAVRGLTPVTSTLTYFKMVDDIDLNNEDWQPLNYDNNYQRRIQFDGANHTIKNLSSYGTDKDATDHSRYGYPSFAGVLYGTIKNLTIENVNIEAKNDKAGAIAGYVGASGKDGHCENVTVKNVTISGTNYIGGFCGQVGNASDTFENCHVLGDNIITQNYGTANSERSTGGFAGHGGTAASYNNCTVKATVEQGSEKTVNAVGGFIGKAAAASTFTDCHVLTGSSVSGHSNVGGFVGYNTAASSYNDCTTAADVTGDGESLGGFVGNSANGKYGNTTPCIASGKVTGSAAISYYIGGFVGLSNAASYKGCSYQGTAIISKASTEGKSALAGGFCGRSEGVSADSFVNCYVYNSDAGTSLTATLQRVGGFIGQSGSGNTANQGIFNGCYVKNMTINPGANNSGGFVGVAYVPLTSCHVEGGSIKAAGNSTGGLAGHVENVNITCCYSTMSVDCNGKSDCGGLVGYLASAHTISKSYYSGKITANGQAIGGIVGKTNADRLSVIENCFTIGDLSTTSQVQIHGGIVGELQKSGSVKNCYSTMTMNGGRVLGGIVGRAAGSGWNYETETSNEISNCIAFNSSISSTQTGSFGSSGAIVGVTSIKNTLKKCYRLYNMTFVNSNSWGNTMVDQEDCDGTNWTRSIATGTGDGNQCAYFGKAAASTATVTTVARDILGWDSNIWDFTGDLPKLIDVN